MILDRIVATKVQEIRELGPAGKPYGPRAGLVRQRLGAPGAIRLIAEIKHRSPSAGPLPTTLTVEERALVYARHAAMISVLCDVTYFDGGWDHLLRARRALDDAGLAVPLLAKEFVIAERQIDEAAARGADAVLLIARIVSPERLAALHAHAVAVGLEPLVEVVSEAEVAVAGPAHVLGVNARDLDTLQMDAARAARVLACIPDDRIALHLSGLKTPADVAALARSGVDGALIGETLMRAEDPGAALAALAEAAWT